MTTEAAPEKGFRVRLTNFEGPFDLLLQLIFAHRLDVTEVALHQVTDEFIAYTREIGRVMELDETTTFLVIAATLLDLKAARLLPAGEVHDEPSTLEPDLVHAARQEVGDEVPHDVREPESEAIREPRVERLSERVQAGEQRRGP